MNSDDMPSTPDAGFVPTSRRAAREAAARAAHDAASHPKHDAAERATHGQTARRTTFEDLLPAEPAAPVPEQPQPQAPRRASLDELFSGEATTEALGEAPPKKSKRQRRRGRWIALAVVVVVLAGIAGGGLWVWNTYEPQIRHVMGWEPPIDYAAGLAHGEALVTINSGDIPSTISKTLYNAGVTKTSGAFYQMLVKSGQNPTFYPGVYKLQKEMTSAAALTALEDPASKLNNSALLREGLTEAQILTTLSETLKMPLADLEAAAKNPADYGVPAANLEGWLFPALYTFDPGVTARDVIKKLVDRTVQSLDKAGVPQADRQRILTIASIVQREARSSADFYKVSRVIQNRLAQGMKLQMDSTAQYGYGEMHDGTVSSSSEALKSDNPWNTYVITGLPKTPIASPGDTAIDAAMHPADGNWLYFVTVNLDTGQTVFSATYADQQKAIAQWQSWCRANPNSGC